MLRGEEGDKSPSSIGGYTILILKKKGTPEENSRPPTKNEEEEKVHVPAVFPFFGNIFPYWAV